MVGKEAVTRAPFFKDFGWLRRKKHLVDCLFSTRWCSVGLKSYHRMASCRGVWTVASGALEGSAEPSRVSPEHWVTQFSGVPGSRCTWKYTLRLVQRMSMATKKSWDNIFFETTDSKSFCLVFHSSNHPAGISHLLSHTHWTHARRVFSNGFCPFETKYEEAVPSRNWHILSRATLENNFPFVSSLEGTWWKKHVL